MSVTTTQRFWRVAQRYIGSRDHHIGLSCRAARFASTSSSAFDGSSQSFARRLHVYFQKRTIVATVTGASVLTFGYLYNTRNNDRFAEDPGDARALEKAPFGKLCSGWMCVKVPLGIFAGQEADN